MTRTITATLGVAYALAASFASAQGQGFSSGSTGADGAFAPSCTPTPCTVSHPLPPNGILNFTTVNIPAGVTVTFTRNVTNTPVVMLATGNVTIAGTIDVSGGNSLTSNFGQPGDRSLPGLAGPGGFDGGRGGGIGFGNTRAGNGLGPGAGGGGNLGLSGGSPNYPQGGGGGGYSVSGSNNGGGAFTGNTGLAGPAYGSNLLVPLVGGSGGGGGAGSVNSAGLSGTGGGGGGGAILIAASGTVNITGSILARGGSGGTAFGDSNTGSAGGGGGSGGAIRIVAASIPSSGTLSVSGGSGGGSSLGGQISATSNGGSGAAGRTTMQVVNAGTLSVSNTPALVISSVAGIAAPASPTGAGDVTVPESTPNPAAVNLMTTGVPPGGTVSVRLTPLRGASTTVTSTPLTGSLTSATASASIDIPLGISTLTASTSFTLTVAQGEALSQFAQNERVERVELVATYGGPQQATLVTVSGKEYVVPAEMLRMAMLGG